MMPHHKLVYTSLCIVATFFVYTNGLPLDFADEDYSANEIDDENPKEGGIDLLPSLFSDESEENDEDLKGLEEYHDVEASGKEEDKVTFEDDDKDVEEEDRVLSEEDDKDNEEDDDVVSEEDDDKGEDDLKEEDEITFEEEIPDEEDAHRKFIEEEIEGLRKELEEAEEEEKVNEDEKDEVNFRKRLLRLPRKWIGKVKDFFHGLRFKK